MKIIASKSTNMRFMRDYNEGKVNAGTALVIGGSISGVSLEAGDSVYRTTAEARQSRNLKNRYVHFKVSLAPQDKDIPNYTFKQIGDRVLKELGYQDLPYTMYRHFDTEHPHIHITVSRINRQGELIRDSFDGLKMKRLEEVLANEFELTPSQDRLITSKGVRLPGYAERWAMKEESAVRKDLQKKGYQGEALEQEVDRATNRSANSKKQYVINAVLESLYDHPSMEVFLKRLARRGISMVRHEFERNGKKNFGISYHYNPRANRARFDAKAMTARVAGDTIPVVDKQYFEHAYFDGVPVRTAISPAGMPQLLLHNAKPIDLQEAISFRAQNLGPLFQEENLFKQLSSVNQSLLQAITFKRTKKKEKELFPQYTQQILQQETPLESRAMVAAELRSEAHLNEVIRSGLQIMEANFNGLGSDNDVDFLRQLLQPSDRPVIEHIDPLMEKYISRFGVEPNDNTSKAIWLLSNENYEALVALLNGNMKLSESEARAQKQVLIDGRINELANPPAAVKRAMSNYARWHKDLQISYEFIEGAGKSIESQTRLLVDALKKKDDEQVRKLLLENIADVKQVPTHLLGNVKDKDLADELMERSVFALPKPKRPKPDIDTSNPTQGSGNNSNLDDDLDQDQEYDRPMGGPRL